MADKIDIVVTANDCEGYNLLILSSTSQRVPDFGVFKWNLFA